MRVLAIVFMRQQERLFHNEWSKALEQNHKRGSK